MVSLQGNSRPVYTRYDRVSASHASAVAASPAGYYQKDDGAVFCAPCDAGTTSLPPYINCSRWRHLRRITHPHQHARFQSTRTQLPLSRTHPALYPSCEAGSFSTTGSSACSPCEAGKYSDASADACSKCSTDMGAGYWSSEGASSCDLAAPKYYMHEDKSSGTLVAKRCPDGVDCSQPGTTVEGMVLTQGTFKFSAESEEVYACPYEANCQIGGVLTGEALCNPGSGGPLCSICDGDYYLDQLASATGSGCVACSNGWWLAPLLTLLLLCVVGAGLFVYRKSLASWYAKVFLSKLSLKFVQLMIALQIICTLKSNHESVGGKGMAEPYASYIAVTSAVNLDFTRLLPFSCLSNQRFDHMDALLAITMAPAGALVVCVAFVQFGVHDAARRATLQSNFTHIMLLAYMTISRQICQSFRCREFDDGGAGVRALDADMSIDCDAERYRGMVAYAVLALLVYSIGIPCALFCKLFVWRQDLNPPNGHPRSQQRWPRTWTWSLSLCKPADSIGSNRFPLPSWFA